MILLLEKLSIPRTCAEMQQTFETYYNTFYLQMVRMSNNNLNSYVQKYIDLLIDLSKNPPSTPSVIRAAIGVVALHRFGYKDFNFLILIFDRLIPQIDVEYVKFTCWCAGRLIHHPDIDQDRYVVHLFERLVGWSRSKGRRARPLAAAYLLTALATNAGSSVVGFFPILQSVIWLLVSHQSTQVLKATADAITKYTRAIVRYRRGILNKYLEFFSQLCMKLLYFGAPIREYASLILYEQLIKSSPDYFLPKMINLYSTIADAVVDEPMLVFGAAFNTLCALSLVDSKLFIDNIADELFANVPIVIFEFPKEVVDSIALLCKSIPVFIKTKIGELLKYAEKLVSNDPDSSFSLLTALLDQFGQEDVLPIEEKTINELLPNKMTEFFMKFFVSLANKNGFFEETPKLLCGRIKKELKSTSDSLIPLKLLAKLPKSAIFDHQSLLDDVIALSRSATETIRSMIPRAMFNLAKTDNKETTNKTIMRLIQNAMNDHSSFVRKSILEVLHENCCEQLSTPECLQNFQIFINDESMTVRKITFQIFASLSELNPLRVSSYSRYAVLDAFFIIRHTPSIREVAQYIGTLPELIKASAKTIKAYSGGFIDIALTMLTQPIPKFLNFMEEDAYYTSLVGVMDSLSLLAPLDPGQVSHYGNSIIPLICDILLSNENRLLSLSILKLFFVLLSAPAYSSSYREKTPMILSACSKFLAKTHSRKARIATLKVLGTIGVLEVHNRSPPPNCESPKNIDDSLARQFFHPSRDSENNEMDESLLLKGENSISQYFSSIVATSLLEIFKDDSMTEYYDETVQALVQVLKMPRMFMLGYFDAFVSRLLDILEDADNEKVKVFMPYYSQLICNSTHNASPFLKRSLRMIHNRFCDDLASPFLDVILAFLNAMRDGYSPYASETICLLLACLDDCKASNAKISNQVLAALEILGVYTIELLYLIVPSVCNAIFCEQTLDEVRICGLEILTTLSKQVDMYPYLGQIIRAVSYGIFFQDNAKTKSASYDLLYTLIKAQGVNFVNSATPLIESLKEDKLYTSYLNQLIEETIKRPGPYKFRPIHSTSEKIITSEKERKNLLSMKPDLISSPSLTQQGGHPFSEDAIIVRIHAPNIGVGRHMEQWMRSLVLAVISNSPSDPIRACTTLATSYPPLAQKLFNAAFLSCWNEISEHGKTTIVESFRQLTLASENYEAVMRDLYDLFVFMDKIEKPLDIKPGDLVKTCMRYGGHAFALYTQQSMFYNDPRSIQIIGDLIDIFVRNGNWPDAVGVWKKCQLEDSSLNKTDVLTRLRMWDQVEPVFRKRFEMTHDFESFFGMSQSMASMAMWPQLLGNYDQFEKLKSHQKRDVSIFFSEAALHSGRWDILEEVLKYAPDGSTRVCALKALNAVHKRDLTTVDDNISYAFSLLASRPITFWSENQKINPDTMRYAQELVEISEMKKWIIAAGEEADTTNAIDEVWNERLKTAPRDFDLWFHLIANRERVIDIRNDNLIKFFLLKSATVGTKIHINAFDLLFPEFEFKTAPDLQKICYVIARWNVGEKVSAISEMEKLTTEISGPLKIKCHFLYASWLLEGEDSLIILKKAQENLKIVVDNASSFLLEKIASSSNGSNNNNKKNSSKLLPIQPRYQHLTIDLESQSVLETIQKAEDNCSSLIFPSQIMKELVADQSIFELYRKWSDVNYSLISLDPSNESQYVSNAIDALTKSARLSPLFPDVVQLLNIFFDHENDENIFNSVSMFIQQLSPKLLIQASPQMLIQLSHQTESVAKFVHSTVLNLLKEHYHALIFSVIVMKKSTNKTRGMAARKILAEFAMNEPEAYQEVELIRKSFLMAAVTWNEKVLQHITDAFDHFQRHRLDRMVASLSSILLIVKKPKCEMHSQFLKLFGKNMSQLEQILKIFNPKNKNSMAQLSQWCKQMQDLIGEELKRIRMIQLSSISQELCEKTGFNIAVPGTYKPGVKINRIQYFVGQLSVYMTKQQPKDVICKGFDGNFYQYLLKGHEDLRLDERIMQFFRLINSLIVKSSIFQQNKIQTTCVIPLSLQHGLVQWVPGTETLRAVVESQRKLHNRDTMEEYNLTEVYSEASFDLLLPVQKYQIIQKIFNDVPDTDIANFFWLKAPNAETWMKQTLNFAISSGMTSIVGHIIGLGDRHPSNLLIDRFTGKVIHIDFGDCFERAAKRSLLPEVVPFRLTRMMVRAMGPTGTDGNFRASFINMSQLLRENKRVLVMVLSTFVHEPLIDPDIEEDQHAAETAPRLTICDLSEAGKSFHPKEEAGIQSSVEMRKRVIQKLTGNDFDDAEKLSVEDQATLLIKTASDPYVLSRMYSGWCPFW